MLGVVYDMLNYTINKDKIVIVGDDEFNPKHILECGQFFRFFINDAGNYIVLTSCYYCEILKTQNGYEILSSHPKVFERLFNLKKDNAYRCYKIEVWQSYLQGVECGEFYLGTRFIESSSE